MIFSKRFLRDHASLRADGTTRARKEAGESACRPLAALAHTLPAAVPSVTAPGLAPRATRE